LGCANKQKKAIDFGNINQNVYTNTYFNLKVPFPGSWYVIDERSRAEESKKWLKMAFKNNENLQAAVDDVDVKNLKLFSLSEHPPGSPVSSNPHFLIVAENVSHFPGIVKGEDYHYHTKKMMELSKYEFSFPNEIYEVQIDSIKFDVLETEIIFGSDIYRSKQYVSILNGYALIFGLKYSNDSDLNKLESIINSISIN